MTTILYGKTFAQQIREEVAAEVEKLVAQGRPAARAVGSLGWRESSFRNLCSQQDQSFGESRNRRADHYKDR